MSNELNENIKIIIKDLLNLIQKHKNKDKERIDTILESQKRKIQTPTNVAKVDYDELFALSFAYVLEGHYEKFLKSFNFATSVFNIHKLNGTMKEDTINKYTPHISYINENLEMFYEIVRVEMAEKN